MKRIIFLLGLLLAGKFVVSQQYVPFPTANANWNVLYIHSENESPPDTVLLRYAIHGDTVINNIQYTKLCLESGDTSNPTVRTVGGLREEGKKIYYIGETIGFPGGYDCEYLLYDFTKQVGDTIWNDSTGGIYTVVLGIDSILIDGSYRKRYKVHAEMGYNHDPDYIIEGIGSVGNGLLGHISPVPTCGYHYWEHICFRENGVVKYLNPAYSECFPSNLLQKSQNVDYDALFKVYPNPFDGIIFVKNTYNNSRLIFKLIDIYGRTVVEKNIAGNVTSVNVNVAPGFYEALIIDSTGKILMSKKLIKK